jgi:hypothetical protein
MQAQDFDFILDAEMAPWSFVHFCIAFL